nr:MAG TPA: hypothetical protein [Caudoviricetes sp.]
MVSVSAKEKKNSVESLKTRFYAIFHMVRGRGLEPHLILIKSMLFL